MGRRWTWAATLLLGCATIDVDDYEACAIDVAPPSLTVAPGEVVVWEGGPLTEVRDTRVTVGGLDATVVAVEREGCTSCDQCRLDAGCSPCGVCPGDELDPDVRESCFGDPLAGTQGVCADCVERLSFEVPLAAPPGDTSVWIVNAHGTTTVRAVTVSPAEVHTGTTTSDHTGATAGTGGSGASTP